jgi:Flp pilus assembly protein TadD
LNKAVDLQPNKAQARNNLGLSLFENEEWDDAVTAYSHAINFET